MMVYKSALFTKCYKKVEQDNAIPDPLTIYSDFPKLINVAKRRTISIMPSFILFLTSSAEVTIVPTNLHPQITK